MSVKSFFAGHTANYFITVCLPQQYQKQKQRAKYLEKDRPRYHGEIKTNTS